MISPVRGRLSRALELIAALATWAVTLALSVRYQQPISVNGGLGWDGKTYHAVAEQLLAHGTAAGPAPFASRVGTGLLAGAVARLAQVPLARGFFIVNALAGALLVVAFLVLLWEHVPRVEVRLGAVALVVTHWAGPVRLPVHQLFVDPVTLVSIALGLVAIDWARRGLATPAVAAVSACAFFGAFCREITLVVPLAFAVAAIAVPAPARLRAVASLLPFFAWAVGTWTVRRMVFTLSSDYAVHVEAKRWLYEKPLPVSLHAVFLTFGLIPVLLVAFREEIKPALRHHPHLLLAAIAFFVLAFIGGDSTERLMAYALVPGLVLAGRILSRDIRALRGFPILATVITAALVGRIFWPIPDYPTAGAGIPDVALIPIGKIAYTDLWSALLSRAHRNEQLVSLAQLLVVSFLAYVFCRRQRTLAS